ncbi:MAG: hypothetical protein AAGA48_39755, partial [Myxococcota bacterium]
IPSAALDPCRSFILTHEVTSVTRGLGDRRNRSARLPTLRGSVLVAGGQWGHLGRERRPVALGPVHGVDAMNTFLPGGIAEPQAFRLFLANNGLGAGLSVVGVVDVHSHPAHEYYGGARDLNAHVPSGVFRDGGQPGGDLHGANQRMAQPSTIFKPNDRFASIIIVNDNQNLGDTFTVIRREPTGSPGATPPRHGLRRRSGSPAHASLGQQGPK